MPGKKITFIGAGSLGFTRSLVKDLIHFPAFDDLHICLMDIHQGRLESAQRAVKHIVDAANKPNIKISATLDRAEALQGADGVLCTILAAPVEIWRTDMEIPLKYGVNINIGDTRGVAGIFRFLRTAPIMMDICRDITRYCPNAIFLNYTNPMAMLCRLMQSQTDALVTGLCHSVQGTAEMLARWIGAPMNEIDYFCAGINHQAHYLKFNWNGQDAYPLIRKAINEREDVYMEEVVRNEMFKALGYYVTESSGHNSEYVSWFRKTPEYLEEYCHKGTSWNTGLFGYTIIEYGKKADTWEQEFKEFLEKPVDLTPGSEYATHIFNAVFGDNKPFEFNGNVRNNGLIDNLPDGCCVEVPVLASRRGLDALKVGKLPPQLALLNSISAQIEEMAVEGSLAGDREMINQAISFDPLTAAVLSLKDIRAMVDEMFAVNEAYLPQFKK